MSTIKELRDQQAQLVAESRAELDKITPSMSDGERIELEKRFDAAMSKFDSLESEISRRQRIESAEARAHADPRRPTFDGSSKGVDSAKSPEYREVFRKYLGHGFDSLDREERSVLSAMAADASEVEKRAQLVGTNSAGGYTVPVEMSTEIDKQLALFGPMLDGSVIRLINTSTGVQVLYPTVNDTSNAGHLTAESSAVDDDGTDDVTFGQKALDAYQYDTGIVKASLALIRDSAFDIESLIAELFGERLARQGNTALTTGSGSSQPNGIVTASSAGKTAASATALAADELIDLLHSVNPAYRASPKAAWMFNDVTLSAIKKLKDGNSNYLWSMGDYKSGDPATLLGKPYFVNPAMANAGASTKPIIFGDLSKYVVRRIGGTEMITLRERYAEYRMLGMLGLITLDGDLMNTAAVKHMVMAAS